ncbi:MAG: radical SAM protein, partial [Candidatus Eisenbacteria bacterium]|nr:radical SAM protein [Candidatus Latescibacterota bacterium]MBD3301057.1 radical SAM protein [Candidatus Eisenbacteria bacterium]
PCTFVRLTGCPMRCVWCDTDYAFEGGEERSIPEILDSVRAHRTSLVEVTGGEPLAQKETPLLLARLADEGFQVLLETGGGLPIENLDPRVVLIYDVKCPDSGEHARNRWENLEHLKPGIDEIKFVLASRRDYEWARGFVAERDLASHHVLLFSPVHRLLEPASLAGWILEDRLPVRLQLQLHKLLWGAEARGV